MDSASPVRSKALRAAVALALAVGAFGLASACTSGEAAHPAASQQTEMKTVVMPVEGMSCVACAASVKKALKAIDGVADVKVNLVERNARIRFAPSKVSSDRLVAAVDSLGYRAGPPTEIR